MSGLCVARSHPEVTVEHVLLRLLDEPMADVPLILKHYEADPAQLARSLEDSAENLLRYLRLPAMANAAADFKAEGKPSVAPQKQRFEDAVVARRSARYGLEQVMDLVDDAG